jgi:hypothetical protein
MRREDAMATVELLYFPDCPNLPAARQQLRRALDELGRRPEWIERDVTAPDAPEHVRGHGSPTILVDGKDVTGVEPGNGSSCRVYLGSDVRGVPALKVIKAALRASSSASPPRGGGVATSLAVVPGALFSVLPIVGCPSCWPAYAGVLSSLGVPFLMDSGWLLPVTAVALVVALAGLGFRARRRRGFRPLVLGAVASAAVLGGKFVLDLDVVVYAGTVLLVAASIWNSWPNRTPATSCGPEGCVTDKVPA